MVDPVTEPNTIIVYVAGLGITLLFLHPMAPRWHGTGRSVVLSPICEAQSCRPISPSVARGWETGPSLSLSVPVTLVGIGGLYRRRLSGWLNNTYGWCGPMREREKYLERERMGHMYLKGENEKKGRNRRQSLGRKKIELNKHGKERSGGYVEEWKKEELGRKEGNSPPIVH